jgi:O-acetyl-ADP-ribose deacetylase (regulator of RNase III)
MSLRDSRLELVQGDITKVTADAIVNAALAGEPEPEGGLGR